ncbi:contactin-2 [Bufo bufo]|uniref:contactin-2 n=1 Tax=Bufo bufo TaxID=8384 RepID=UPI001ABEAD6B|nr:contactin-2 [Bufo bufo]
MNLLQKGLSFSPTGSLDTLNLDTDLQRFYRNIRLKAHFSSEHMVPQSVHSETGTGSLTAKMFNLKIRSTFSPPRLHHPIETFINLVQRDVETLLQQCKTGNMHLQSNLPLEEKRALDQLLEDKSLVFKPADKGGALVVLDKAYYVSEILSQLNDTDTYQILQNDPVFRIKEMIQIVVNAAIEEGVIDATLGGFLVNQHPITPVFYTLPKVHKSIVKPPDRPIVASTDSILSPLAIFLEKIFTPFTKLSPSYLRDTEHFLQEIKTLHSEKDDLLVTFDVCNLYTSISHEKGLKAIDTLLQPSHYNNAESFNPIKGSSGGYGPVFEEQPQNTLFPEGSEELLTLACRARAIPPATYRWKLNGTELNLMENSSYQLVGGNLAISNPTHSKHTGTYQCVATNPRGTVLSNEASLRFGYLHEFPPEERDTVKTTEGWGVMLPCNPPLHYPGLSYRWLLNEFPVFLPTDSRRFVSQVTGNLYIAQIDAQDEGGYSCLTTSHIAFTTKSVYSSFTQLSITPEAEPRLYAPSIKVRFPGETYTLSRQSVTLECFAFGNPVPRIRWRKVDTSQPPQWFASDPILHIESVSFDDDGTYECEAENSKGRDTYQGRVIVQAQPEWLQIISDTEAKIGSDLLWNCAASGKPRPTIRWLKDGKALTSQARMEVSNGQLKITNLDPQDSGMYQCVAGNKHGTIYTGAELTVQTMAPDFRLSPVKPLIPAARGGEITIHCNPRAAPTPVILWSKGTELLRNSSRITVTSNGTLILKNISRADEGNYTCFAENIMGKSNSTGILSVRGEMKLLWAPSGSDINEGDSDTLQCHASHDPTMDLTFTWELDGMPINFEKEEDIIKSFWDESVGDLHIINTKLRHAGKYRCTAQTVVDRASASASLLVRGPPGPPGGVVARNAKETSIQLSWSRGFDNHNPISRYTVEVKEPEMEEWKTARTDPATVEGNAESALVVGLTPWTDYQFRVVASNILGAGEPSFPSAIIRTKEAAPIVAPSGLNGGGGAPNELTITWKSLERKYQNGDGFGYIIAFKRMTEETWQTVKILGAQSQHFVYRNESIAAYTPFNVMIKAFNQKGKGPYSLETIVYSAEEEPSISPSDVKTTFLSSSEIKVEFKSVATVKGVLLGYEIRYWKAGDNAGAADRVRSESLDTVAKVSGLKPNTLYHVTVHAYNRAGTGPPSPIANVTTTKSPPNRPPGNISWTLSRSSVRIKWDPLISMKNESSVTEYKILYRVDSHSTPTLYVTSKTQAELPVPEGANHVTIQLRATGLGGDGEAAEVHIPTNSGTSMMVENSASQPFMTKTVAVLVLIRYLAV